MRPLPNLPVGDVLAPLVEVLAQKGAAVLVAPPGAGKTTLVPLHLLSAPFATGRIVLVEPRRLAARASARRMAELLGETVGETVGWRMRLDTRVSSATRIEVVTEGVFARMIQGDPELAGVSVVILDEFHERSLDADLSLAFALDVQGALREDLRLLVMSATLDGARVARLLNGAPVVESLGRAFPVAVRYRERPPTQAVEDAAADAVRAALREENGSILVFLPGQREIQRTAERLASIASDAIAVMPLFGALDAGVQDRAIRPAPANTRKVVLATSIAETSITIDGVSVVIDSGLRRAPVFEPATGLSRLETVRVSRAGADQRAGRAGRTGPGVAIRLWREEQTAALDPFETPEILSSDLSGLVLDCAAWGVADPRRLAFLDAPPEAALNEARALLEDLGALGADGRLSASGEAMQALPLPPRLARMVADAPREMRLTAARLAVLLTERGLGGTDIDLVHRLRRFRDEARGRSRPADELARRIAGRDAGEAAHDDAGALLALAYPDRIAAARGARGAFVLANGRGGTVDAASPLAASPFLVVAELQGTARASRILAAVDVSRETLEDVLRSRIATETLAVFDWPSGEVRARRVRRIGRVSLAEAPVPVPPGAAAPALADAVRARGLAVLGFDKDGQGLRRRLGFLHATLGEPWPDVSDAVLLATLEDWLLPFAPGATRLADFDAATLGQALLALVPGDLGRRLDSAAPTHFEAPTGSRLPIRYEAEGPVLPVRVQELFGLTRHPALAEGRLPLILELLSPAHRPIQITRDLPGFWAGSWRDVRADLRGRYPKHFWPEDPARAAPTARTKPRNGA